MFLKEELPKVMQAPCNPMVTNCIREELRKIGEDVSGASLIAKRFTCIRCTCKVAIRPASPLSAHVRAVLMQQTAS